jgi:hypothetical protein
MSSIDIQISGPSSYHIFEYEGIVFHIFGDQHESKTIGSCQSRSEIYGDVLCDSINYTFDGINIANSDCWSIGALFEEWFTYNNDMGIPTDVYFEASFTKTGERKFSASLKVVEERRKHNKSYKQLPYDDSIDDITTEWLAMLGLYFDECLKPNKTKCHYLPFVHMHYVDIRSVFYDKSELSDEHFSRYSPDILNFSLDGDFVNYLAMANEYMREVRNLEKYVDKFNKDIVDFNNIFFNLIGNVKEIISDFYFGEISLVAAIDKYSDYILKITEQKDVQRIYLDKLKFIGDTAVVRNDNELMTRTAAEYKRLQKLYPTIAEKLKQFIFETATSAQDEYFKYYENRVSQIIHDKVNSSNVVYLMFDMLEKMYREMVPFAALNMDIYTISRIFVQYFLRRDQIEKNQIQENKNYQVILYAGHGHNVRYIKFLLQYLRSNFLFEYPAYTDERCVFVTEPYKNLQGIFEPYLYRHHYLNRNVQRDDDLY